MQKITVFLGRILLVDTRQVSLKLFYGTLVFRMILIDGAVRLASLAGNLIGA